MNEIELRHSLAAYVIGALEPGERAELETHLSTCVDCTRELASMAALPGLMSRLDVADMERPLIPEIESGPELLDRTLNELARRRGDGRRRQRFLAVAAAAALIAIGGGGFALIEHVNRTPSVASSTRTVSASNAATGVRASVDLLGKQWGTAITLRLGGVEPGTHCQLIVIDKSGQRYSAGSWEANYEGAASITGAVEIQPSQIASMVIETTDGEKLLNLST